MNSSAEKKELTENISPSMIEGAVRFCLDNKLITLLATAVLITWGVVVAPFDWEIDALPRDPVAVDAIPDIGENQQIVFTEWRGHSPQDIEDQITYPLTVALLGVPGVRTVRSYSMFGFSSIYVIFKDNIDFYWSRSRILEKLSSLPRNSLPDKVQPTLGPDATSLGQVYWYTLEGLDENGNPTGGWDLDELRSIQDWQVRYALQSAEGISEVSSVGGYVREYQIDVNPDALKSFNVTLEEVFAAVRTSNADVGARTIEVNQVEYVVRGLGFIRNVADIENTLIKSVDGQPIRVSDVATVGLGPAPRRGALDKGGVEAVGGVAVVRYGFNPLEAIKNLKDKIAELSLGLPQKTLADGTVSKVTIVPFYDRTNLIAETLGTLEEALTHEIIVTIIVIVLALLSLRNALLVSGLLPMAVLMTFIAMKLFGVDANIVALSGIAIAIGAMVDMGIIISENITRQVEEAGDSYNPREIILRATREMGGAIVTAVSTTVVSFLPVFTMVAAEGKLFKPLAYTKTFALLSSLVVALFLIPVVMEMTLTRRKRLNKSSLGRWIGPAAYLIAGVISAILLAWWIGLILIIAGLWRIIKRLIPKTFKSKLNLISSVAFAVFGLGWLVSLWMPLGPESGFPLNFIFTLLLIGIPLGSFYTLNKYYSPMLKWCLSHKKRFLLGPIIFTFVGVFIWLGFESMFGWLPQAVRSSSLVSPIAHAFPGLGKQFMPPLDEGSFLFMPTTMPHASIGEALDILHKQDALISSLPEISETVGKLGRVESALDPAPLSMFETVINYHSEFLKDEDGQIELFEFDEDSVEYSRGADGDTLLAPDGKPYFVQGAYLRNSRGRLIPDNSGTPFRLWRKALDPELNPDRKFWAGVNNSDDIWKEIVRISKIPGVTLAPKLQPIATRLIMLQSGMRAPMGIKVKGPDLKTIEDFGVKLERYLKEVPSVEPAAVFADRVVGKPYLEITLDRDKLALYGVPMRAALNAIEIALGGKTVTMTVEGRERYAVRVRYQRELRDNIEDLGRILVSGPLGALIPLEQLSDIDYVQGPQTIKSEDTFLLGYVLFDMKAGYAEVDVVLQAQEYISSKISSGELVVPEGVSYAFAGSYENQIRAEKTLRLVVPLALMIIMLILYLQFRSFSTTLLIFAGVFVAWSGGFIMIWLYGQDWFMNFGVFGANIRDIFQMREIHLSVAVWVGFLALFGIATDNGVVISTILQQKFDALKPNSVRGVRDAVMNASLLRIRPALMTTATTMLALIPVLTSTGRGADIMVPMAIPTFGGMAMALLTVFTVPTIYCMLEEMKLKKST